MNLIYFFFSPQHTKKNLFKGLKGHFMSLNSLSQHLYFHFYWLKETFSLSKAKTEIFIAAVRASQRGISKAFLNLRFQNLVENVETHNTDTSPLRNLHKSSMNSRHDVIHKSQLQNTSRGKKSSQFYDKVECLTNLKVLHRRRHVWGEEPLSVPGFF